LIASTDEKSVGGDEKCPGASLYQACKCGFDLTFIACRYQSDLLADAARRRGYVLHRRFGIRQIDVDEDADQRGLGRQRAQPQVLHKRPDRLGRNSSCHFQLEGLPAPAIA
jgi:hypothetical protein